MEIIKGIVVKTPEGDKVFATMAEAKDFIRSPKIKEALLSLTDGNEELSDWLLEKRDVVERAFETGTIRRVTNKDKEKLAAAAEGIKAFAAANPTAAKEFQFFVDHAEDIRDGFRYPTVARMSEEDKAFAAKNTLVMESEGNEELADWVLANKDPILEAYEAGKDKKPMNPKAAEALAKWRAQKAAKGETSTEANEAAEAPEADSAE